MKEISRKLGSLLWLTLVIVCTTPASAQELVESNCKKALVEALKKTFPDSIESGTEYRQTYLIMRRVNLDTLIDSVASTLEKIQTSNMVCMKSADFEMWADSSTFVRVLVNEKKLYVYDKPEMSRYMLSQSRTQSVLSPSLINDSKVTLCQFESSNSRFYINLEVQQSMRSKYNAVSFDIEIDTNSVIQRVLVHHPIDDGVYTTETILQSLRVKRLPKEDGNGLVKRHFLIDNKLTAEFKDYTLRLN